MIGSLYQGMTVGDTIFVLVECLMWAVLLNHEELYIDGIVVL